MFYNTSFEEVYRKKELVSDKGNKSPWVAPIKDLKLRTTEKLTDERS